MNLLYPFAHHYQRPRVRYGPNDSGNPLVTGWCVLRSQESGSGPCLEVSGFDSRQQEHISSTHLHFQCVCLSKLRAAGVKCINIATVWVSGAVIKGTAVQDLVDTICLNCYSSTKTTAFDPNDSVNCVRSQFIYTVLQCNFNGFGSIAFPSNKDSC